MVVDLLPNSLFCCWHWRKQKKRQSKKMTSVNIIIELSNIAITFVWRFSGFSVSNSEMRLNSFPIAGLRLLPKTGAKLLRFALLRNSEFSLSILLVLIKGRLTIIFSLLLNGRPLLLLLMSILLFENSCVDVFGMVLGFEIPWLTLLPVITLKIIYKSNFSN